MKISAGILPYTKNKTVLMLKSTGSNIWGIPKGEQDKNESLEITARRELFEETGIVAPDNLLYLGFVCYSNKKKTVHCYAFEVNEIPKITLSWEHDKYKWMPIDRAIAKSHKDQKFLIEELIKKVW